VPRFSSRTLDIDIIFFDDLILNGPGHLQIPRPELKHAFVLGPLAQIAPDFVNPETGVSLAESLNNNT
jgi:2-amino-4-hydroxy-6-hydroxymethyldihydropteridine diphosphokinase